MKMPIWMVGAIGFAMAGLTLTGCSDDDPVCRGAEQNYAIGATFEDGCRSCTCNEDTSITCTATDACTTGCDDGTGTIVDVGAFWPVGDGCNVCQCQADGSADCTTNMCGVACVYGGQQRTSGSTFPALDGCNDCTCESDGSVSCTELPCACDAATEWWRDYVGNSPSECAVIDFGCPANTTAFENDCGCGCQQSQDDCEESYDCTPGNTCDVAQLMMDCPYSEILE